MRGTSSPASIVFLVLLWFALLFAVLCLVVLIVNTFIDGVGRLDGNLFTEYASQGSRSAGVPALPSSARSGSSGPPLSWRSRSASRPACTSRSSPTRTTWFNRFIELNLQNLAAVPAIIYGMLAVGFALAIGLEQNIVLGGAIALALLILPVIIIATRESLRAVPAEIRQGSLALGRHAAADGLAADPALGGARYRDRHDPRPVPGAR